MIVREAKLLSGSKIQYQALDQAIRTAQFIRNKAVRFWRDHKDVNKARLSLLCKELAKEFPFARQLNSMARQASAERAWSSISNFYRRCKLGVKKKGYPQFKKHSRSVEYKTTGWKLSSDYLTINFTDGFAAGKFSLFCNHQTREDLFRLKINRVRVVKKADGYYAQFCLDANRKEKGNYTGNVVGLDLGLIYFYKDQNDNAAIYPKYLRRAEKRLKKLQRRLSRKFVKGKKPQSNNYHKARKRLGKSHLKVQRRLEKFGGTETDTANFPQRKDWAVKQARCVVMSSDIVVYVGASLPTLGGIDLKISNMVSQRVGRVPRLEVTGEPVRVKNHHLAKSISDAGWYQFTQWLDYFGKIYSKTVIAVNPNYTSTDCSNCGYRVKKSLSTRWRSLPEGLTHKCPRCHTKICRDTNAALNILKRGFEVLGIEFNSTQGHWETAEYSETRRRDYRLCC